MSSSQTPCRSLRDVTQKVIEIFHSQILRKVGFVLMLQLIVPIAPIADYVTAMMVTTVLAPA